MQDKPLAGIAVDAFGASSTAPTSLRKLDCPSLP
jgi:hypothetical protein